MQTTKPSTERKLKNKESNLNVSIPNRISPFSSSSAKFLTPKNNRFAQPTQASTLHSAAAASPTKSPKTSSPKLLTQSQRSSTVSSGYASPSSSPFLSSTSYYSQPRNKKPVRKIKDPAVSSSQKLDSPEIRRLHSVLDRAHSVITTVHSTINSLKKNKDVEADSNIFSALEFMSCILQDQIEIQNTSSSLIPNSGSSSPLNEKNQQQKTRSCYYDPSQAKHLLQERESERLRVKVRQMEKRMAELQDKYDDAESKLSFLEMENASLNDQLSPSLASATKDSESSFGVLDSEILSAVPPMEESSPEVPISTPSTTSPKSPLRRKTSYDSAISVEDLEGLSHNITFKELEAFLHSNDSSNNPVDSKYVKQCFDQDVATCLPFNSVSWYDSRCIRHALLQNTIELSTSTNSNNASPDTPSGNPCTCSVCSMPLLGETTSRFRLSATEEWRLICTQCTHRFSSAVDFLNFFRQLPQEKLEEKANAIFIHLIDLKRDMFYAKHGIALGCQ